MSRIVFLMSISLLLYGCSDLCDAIKDVSVTPPAAGRIGVVITNHNPTRYVSATLEVLKSDWPSDSSTILINRLAPHEKRTVPFEKFIQPDSVIVAAAIYPDVPVKSYLDSSYIALIVSILVTLIGSFLTIIVSLRIARQTKVENSGKEKKILIAELEDIKRHYEQNLKVIYDILVAEQIPALFYFERLKCFESLILFSPDTYRTLHERYAPEVSHIRLQIRNVNIEIEECISYIKTNNCKKDILQDYYEHLKGKANFMLLRIDKSIRILKDLPKDEKLDLAIAEAKPKKMVCDKSHVEVQQ